MAQGLGSGSLSKVGAESLLAVGERIWDEEALPEELSWSAIRMNFWFIQTLPGFLFASYWVKYCTAEAGAVNEVAESAADQVLFMLNAKLEIC